MASSSLQLHLPLPPATFIRVKASLFPTHLTRRKMGTASVLIGSVLLLSAKPASAFDFRLTEPEQTVDEARSTIIEHARSLLEVKPLIESGFWRDGQQQLRRSSANLKQDIYTIIQSKPKSSQKELNNLYFELFNNVSKLDYAARDEDEKRVRECYNNIVMALDDIFSKIL